MHDLSLFRFQCGDISLLSKYVLDHWKKCLASNYTLIKGIYDDLHDNLNTQRHDHFMSLFSKIAKPVVSRNEERY